MSKEVWQWNERIASRTIDDESVIIGIDANEVHLTNSVGSFIWNKLEHGCDMNSLILAITDTFDVTEQEAKTDTLEYIENLSNKGLISKK